MYGFSCFFIISNYRLMKNEITVHFVPVVSISHFTITKFGETWGNSTTRVRVEILVNLSVVMYDTGSVIFSTLIQLLVSRSCRCEWGWDDTVLCVFARAGAEAADAVQLRHVCSPPAPTRWCRPTVRYRAISLFCFSVVHTTAVLDAFWFIRPTTFCVVVSGHFDS